MDLGAYNVASLNKAQRLACKLKYSYVPLTVTLFLDLLDRRLFCKAFDSVAASRIFDQVGVTPFETGSIIEVISQLLTKSAPASFEVMYKWGFAFSISVWTVSQTSVKESGEIQSRRTVFPLGSFHIVLRCCTRVTWFEDARRALR